MDEEIWKPIPGYEGYEASSHGRIRSFWKSLGGKKRGWTLDNKPQKILTVSLQKWGYFRVCLSKEGHFHHLKVHRLVLLAFIGPCPPGMQACHIDGNPANNHLDNLKWDTPKVNMADRDKHGTTSKGEKRWKSKLTAENVRNIRDMATQGYSQANLAKLFSVNDSVINRIIHRKSWKHI